MAKLSKFFCIAVSGATCDGRTLDDKMLQEMADTYDPKTYQARVNMEHIRGFSHEAPFHAYGDVVALETRDVELQLGGKAEKKLGLFAQVNALDNLLAVKEKGQKLFSSIELNPNFAGTGKAYLQGLAVTDSPASLGTEVMEFAAKASVNPFAERKIDKGNFFSAGHAVEGFDFDTVEAPKSEADGAFAAMRSFFAGLTNPKPAEPEKPTPPANDNSDVAKLTGLLTEGLGKMTGAIEASHNDLTAKITALQADHSALKSSVESTDKSQRQRPPATGQNGNYAKTDC